jgi:hypothetical protein
MLILFCVSISHSEKVPIATPVTLKMRITLQLFFNVMNEGILQHMYLFPNYNALLQWV